MLYTFFNPNIYYWQLCNQSFDETIDAKEIWRNLGMDHQTIKRILVFSLCAVIISLSGCSKGEEEQKEKEVVTTVLEKLFTIPNQKMQDAYEEATKMAEQDSSETTEPGAYGVYDFQKLLEEMYGSYFTEEGIESIPYWIYTNLNVYAADRDVTVTFKSADVQPEESSEGNYYTFVTELEYSIGGEEASFEQNGTVLFEDGKIKNIYFADGLMTEIENQLFM